MRLYVLFLVNRKTKSSFSPLKCTLPPFFFSLKWIYLLFEILLRVKFLIWINPRFSVPRRNLQNTAIFVAHSCYQKSQQACEEDLDKVLNDYSTVQRKPNGEHIWEQIQMQNKYKNANRMETEWMLNRISNLNGYRMAIVHKNGKKHPLEFKLKGTLQNMKVSTQKETNKTSNVWLNCIETENCSTNVW